MAKPIRRVVTGHDDQGRAKVLIDETVKNVVSQRPGALYSVIWSSDGFPVNNDGEVDPSGKKIGTTIPGSTIGSLTNNTGTDLASAIIPPKLSLMRSTLIGCRLFPTKPN